MFRLKNCFVLCILVALCECSALAASSASDADSMLVESLLARANTLAAGDNDVLYFAKQFIGTPYVAHTLEPGDSEHLIVNTRELDCTTFVETVVALTMCHRRGETAYADFCRHLTELRYRDGRLTDYTSRLHYFAWWAEDAERKGIAYDVLNDCSYSGLKTGTFHINYMTTHPSSYKHLARNPHFVPVIRRFEQQTNGKTFRYLPKTYLNRGRSELSFISDGDIAGIVTSKAGLDTSHLGFLVWQNGRLHLLHASSLKKKVVLDSTTFYDYSNQQRSQTGIRVLRIKN